MKPQQCVEAVGLIIQSLQDLREKEECNTRGGRVPKSKHFQRNSILVLSLEIWYIYTPVVKYLGGGGGLF